MADVISQVGTGISRLAGNRLAFGCTVGEAFGMDSEMVDAYLARIGASRTSPPADLQELHLRAVPFENLSIHLGEPIVLDEDALVAKVVTRRRGGFCYELNGAFAALLRAGSTLLDVGFGDFSLRPLRLDVRDDQEDPCGTFRVVDGPDGDLDLLQDGEPQYRLELRPRTLADFGPTCWYQQTSPDSPFTKRPLASLPTAKGRVTVSGSTLITTEDGQKSERELADAELLDAYRGLFGIGLDALPTRSASEVAL